MKQKFLIFFGIFVLIAVLIGLNAAAYNQKATVPDSELKPNRSTYNTGATGTRAFYDLLAETGRRVSRWQESPSALLANDKNKPQTLVIIGATRKEISEDEITQILRWVTEGGKLVLIDRAPPDDFLKTTANYAVINNPSNAPMFNLDPTNQKQMTTDAPAAKPTQPSIFTERVNAVQPSRFASSINFARYSSGEVKPDFPKPAPTSGKYKPLPQHFPTASGEGEGDEPANDENVPMREPPPPAPLPPISSAPPIAAKPTNGTVNEMPAPEAPFAHLSDGKKVLLADFPFGAGQIVYLSDPYIVSNNGINLVDNAQLAINVVASREGIIAFDEYHQGFGTNNNRLLAYFAGTPLAAIALQLAALLGLIFLTQSRRFARPVPAPELNRLSKLEYVGAMAELQQRTKAFDLAMENIYTDFRRRAARSVGVDNFKTIRPDLARMLAERGNLNADELDQLMFKCEDIIHGEPTNKREMVKIITQLREVEDKLNLKRRQRSRKVV